MQQQFKTYDELDARQRRAVKVLETCLGTARLQAVYQVQIFDEAELTALDEIHTDLVGKPIGDRVRDVINSHTDRVERERIEREKAAAPAAADETQPV
jgi:hypothetical protein